MRAIVAWVLVCLLALGASARGADPHSIYPRLTRQHFTTLIAPLDLDEEQRLIARLLFADYASAMSDLAIQAAARANEAGRGRVEETLTGRRRMSPEELRAQRIAVLEVLREVWPLADEHRHDLIGTLLGVLSEDQRTLAADALPPLRRAIWLDPWRRTRNERDYAGDGLDLVAVAESAGNRELEGVDAQELSLILAGYEIRLDALLVELGPLARAAALDRRIARISHDSARLREAEAAAIEQWRHFYALNRQTSEAIAELATQARGPAAGDAWSRRVLREMFPWLLGPSGPERRIEWIREAGVDDAALQKAEKAFLQYTARSRALTDEAVALMLKGRLENGRILHPAIDAASVESAAERSIYQELLKNSGARAHAERTANEKLEAALPPDRRVEMRRKVR